ncbi:MAG: hypothetical protein ACK53L_29600, partial [Pirellulaceae bacterium]
MLLKELGIPNMQVYGSFEDQMEDLGKIKTTTPQVVGPTGEVEEIPSEPYVSGLNAQGLVLPAITMPEERIMV